MQSMYRKMKDLV